MRHRRRALVLLALAGLFKLGLWWSEAIGVWMIRLRRLYGGIASYRGEWRLVTIALQPIVVGLWLLTRASFLAVYFPTRWAGSVLAGTG
jgi:hypothetical protein